MQIVYFSNAPTECAAVGAPLVTRGVCAAPSWQIEVVLPQALVTPGVIDLTETPNVTTSMSQDNVCHGSATGITGGSLEITSLNATNVVVELNARTASMIDTNGVFDVPICP